MSETYARTDSSRTITNTHSATISAGYCVDIDGALATSVAKLAGVVLFDAEVGEPMTVQTGRVRVKFTGTPGAGVELTVNTDGTLKAAVSTETVIGFQAEVVTVDEPALGMAEVLSTGDVPYIKP